MTERKIVMDRMLMGALHEPLIGGLTIGEWIESGGSVHVTLNNRLAMQFSADLTGEFSPINMESLGIGSLWQAQ